MLRRLSLVLRGLAARRSRPNLESLAREENAERFVWAVLPHAARSFATSIVVLPRRESTVAAVAYLYARMLDTYEDLLPEADDRPAALRSFADRLGSLPHPPPMPISQDLAVDAQDRLHILLVEKVHLVDEVFATLTTDQQRAIADLVGSMADGMTWSSERFAVQGGVLIDDDQLLRYCRNVIGLPALFVIELITGSVAGVFDDALATSEMIQLANITRDIERDLVRGIAYDPSLRSHLGRPTAPAVCQVRERLLGMAMSRAPSYQRLYLGADLARRPGTRLAAVLMLMFTDLHYRSMAHKVGRRPWPGPRGKVTTVLAALPAFTSSRYASWTIDRVTDRLAAAAVELGTAPSVRGTSAGSGIGGDAQRMPVAVPMLDETPPGRRRAGRALRMRT